MASQPSDRRSSQEAAGLVDALDWPGPVTVLLVVVAAAVALACTVRRMHLSQRVLHVGDARVTRIELALSAWEAQRLRLPGALTRRPWQS